MGTFRTTVELQALAESGYIIMCGDSCYELSENVRLKLCEGYSLYGNPYALIYPADDHSGACSIHFQAMIRGI